MAENEGRLGRGSRMSTFPYTEVFPIEPQFASPMHALSHISSTTNPTRYLLGIAKSLVDQGARINWLLNDTLARLHALSPPLKMDDLSTEPPTDIDPYQVLRLEATVSTGEVKTAYKKLALRYHPGKVAAP